MPAWRNKLQASLFMLVGVAGLITGVALIGFQMHNSSRLSAYRSASTCASAGEAVSSTACRYSGPATVTSGFDPATRSAGIVFTDLAGHEFVARFTTVAEPDTSTGSKGSSVEAELWDGQVIRFAGIKTVDSPDNIPGDMTLAGIIFAAVGAVVTAFAVMLVRVAWRR
jgi:hypothetical protein